MGTFSVGDKGAGSELAGGLTTTASGAEDWTGVAANPCAMSSKVRPLVSGTFR